MNFTKTLVLGTLVVLAAAGALADPATAPIATQAPAATSQTTAPNSASAGSVPATTPPAAPGSAQTPPPHAQSEEDLATYTAGYSDGCASANLRYARQEHVKPNKDAALYDSDKGYHDGWNHGYRTCEDHVTPGALSVPGNSVIM